MREIKIRYRIKIGDKIATYIYPIEKIEKAKPGRLQTDEFTQILSRDLFTGLEDCRGVKIFEGDIVTDSMHRMKNVDVIEWVDCGWGTRDDDNWDYKGFDEIALRKRFEIIGNIYSNPELLEVK